MSNFTPITKDLIAIGSVETGQMEDVAENITSLGVSLTMDQASELSFSVIDPDFLYARNNYFQIRRDVFYRELVFEIARVEVGKSASIHPEFRLVCYNKNVQMMKRDKQPEAYRGISASDYARTVAKRFNMNTFIEETPKKQSIVKGRSNDSDENVWNVLQRSAADADFVCFEVDNCLFFCSQRFLLGKWGDPDYQYMGNYFVPFGWPENDNVAFPGSKDKYMLLDMPKFTRSENDPMDSEGSLMVDRINGVQIRPGMTINVTGIPDFENGYLVTDVSFEEGVNDPVEVSFRTPAKPGKGQKGKPDSGGSGGPGASPDNPSRSDSFSGSVGDLVAELEPMLVSEIQDYINRNFVSDLPQLQKNRLIRIETLATVTAAARVYSLPTLKEREKEFLQQLQLLGISNFQIGLAALRSIELQLRSGPATSGQSSGFPTDGVINAQYSLGVGLITSGLVPAATVPTERTPTSPQNAPVRRVVSGRLPNSIVAKIRNLVSDTPLDQFVADELLGMITSNATRIYNLTSINEKKEEFGRTVRHFSGYRHFVSIMLKLEKDLIPEQDEVLLRNNPLTTAGSTDITSGRIR